MGYPPIPVSQTTLLRYTVHLARRLAANSIKKYLNIVRIMHLEYGLTDPLRDNWVLTSLLKGICRSKGLSVHRKLPITPSLLLAIRNRLNFNNIVDSVFWAISLVAFFGFLRKSNLLPPSSITFNPAKHLCREDLSLFSGGLILHIRWSKTLQFAERLHQAPLPHLPNHPLCPVWAVVNAFSHTRGAPAAGPAFVLPVKGAWTPFPPTKFISLLRSHLQALGLQARDYSGHSFRRGAASWALKTGLPGEIIKILGDWKSDAYQNYLSLSHDVKFRSINVFGLSLPST